jgi:DNA repair protein RecO (recombination protein O)
MPGRPTTRTRAVVLARTKLAEQDLIVTMLDDAGRQLRAVAKGARKPGGRMASRVELFCEVDALVSMGRGLGILSDVALVDAHRRLRGDMDRVSAASAICEVARLTCYEDVGDAYLMPILSRALRACEQADGHAQLDIAASAYALKVLSHEGWRPELAGCVACGDGQLSHFSVGMGGALCASCAKDVPDVRELSPRELSWLRALIGCTFDELMATQAEPGTSFDLACLVHEWCARHLEARLRAWEFMLGM